MIEENGDQKMTDTHKEETVETSDTQKQLEGIITVVTDTAKFLMQTHSLLSCVQKEEEEEKYFLHLTRPALVALIHDLEDILLSQESSAEGDKK